MFEVVQFQDRRVRFIPTLPSRLDLQDAGFAPGRRYRVTVDGFPKASGVRSTAGAVLERTETYEFEVIDAARAGDRPMFEDRSPLQGPILSAVAGANPIAGVAPGEPPTLYLARHGKLELAFDEPLRPDTLTPDAVSVEQAVPIERGAGGDVKKQARPVPVDDVRVQNQKDGSRLELKLRLDASFEQPGWEATLVFSPRVTDLGGNPLRDAFGRVLKLIPSGAAAR